MDNRIPAEQQKLGSNLSVLHLLKRSIKSLHSLRKGKSLYPGRLKGCSSSSNSFQSKEITNTDEEIRHSYQSFQSKKTTANNRSDSNSAKFSNTHLRYDSPMIKRSFHSKRIAELTKQLNNPVRKIDFKETEKNDTDINENKEMLIIAQSKINDLNENNTKLETKINKIEENLCRASTIHIEEQTTLLSIINKLEKFEDIEMQKKSSATDSKIPKVIEKISNLESNYESLLLSKEGTLKSFKENLNQVNRKLEDLKECNNILKELVTFIPKEPVRKSVKNAET